MRCMVGWQSERTSVDLSRRAEVQDLVSELVARALWSCAPGSLPSARYRAPGTRNLSPRAHARRRGRRLRLGVADGPPRRAGRARARHVRRLDARRRARGAHHDDPHRPPRHLRPVPPPGGAGQDGRDGRRALRRPARARARLGFGRARARDVRDRRGPAARARGAAARDDRDPRPDVRGRAVRPRRRAPRCTARSAARARCSCRGRRCTSAAPGPQLTMPIVRDHADWWNCPTYAVDRLAELRPLAGRRGVSVQHPVGLARDRAERATTSWSRARAGSAAGAGSSPAPRPRSPTRSPPRPRRRRGLRDPAHRLRPPRDHRPVHGRR